MSTPEQDLRARMIAEALKQRQPMVSPDPTATAQPDLDAAARAFAAGLGKSAREQAGVLYVDPGNTYSYSIPVTQHLDSFNLQTKSDANHKLAGIFHVHPSDDATSQVFSDKDVAVANQLKVPSYVLFTHDNEIRKYVPGQTKTTHMMRDGFINALVSRGDPLQELSKALVKARAETAAPVSQPPTDIGEGN